MNITTDAQQAKQKTAELFNSIRKEQLRYIDNTYPTHQSSILLDLIKNVRIVKQFS